MAEERQTLYLVDGSGYIFRAFFALPRLNNSRGLPTNATYGFIRMLLKLLKEARPTHIAVVFDSARKTFRDELFESYKANRAETPSDLLQQIPFIYRAVDQFRISRLVIDGYEADDVIGTLAVQAARDGFNAVIVTGDKDFMQLVSPHITLWDTMFGKRTGMREVRERFGVEPRTLVDVMALMGDSIDNVKGVPGIGEKTASMLMQHYGSLEALFAGLDKLDETKIRGAKKLAGVLAAHQQDIELARKLVRVDTEVALDFKPGDLAWPGIDEKGVAGLLRELEFGSLLTELTPSAKELPQTRVSEEIHADSEALPAVLAGLRHASRLALHLGGDQSGAIVLKLMAAEESRIYLLRRQSIPAAAELLASSSPSKACHDLKRHIGLLRRYGVELGGVDFDTMLAGFLINPGKPEPAIVDLYHEHLAPLGGDAAAGSDPAVIEALRQTLMRKLTSNNLESLFDEIELPLARVLADMEAAGIGIDGAALKAISAEFAGQLDRLEHECYELAGREFNLNSPVQLREILFTHLGLSVKGLKKTKSGYSTDADTLEKLAGVHPMPHKLLEYRAIAKLKSTYSDALPELIDASTGRIHTSFHQALTATGRLSSSDPNLQNIPTRSEEGRRIRRAFVPAPGYILLSADYSQIELRILAHMSGEPALIDAFAREEDIHTRTAREILGGSRALDADARRLAKVINFGIIYGMGPQRLAGELGIPLSEAADYIKRYFEQLPRVRSYFEQTLKNARECGYVTTIYGRRRYLPELNGPDGGARAQAERIAVNTPIQGSAADLIKLAMVRLHAILLERGLPARIVLQVHDELLLEVQNASLEAVREELSREMEGVASLRVPLRVELKIGSNWGDLQLLGRTEMGPLP
ncbi:MAG: DNA polymerase I, partial [Deltaproteobacteria bacterium]|nr:DNA polymerase I [Deltaproteobacteria bacterium]